MKPPGYRSIFKKSLLVVFARALMVQGIKIQLEYKIYASGHVYNHYTKHKGPPKFYFYTNVLTQFEEIQ